jgi:hypothetical protein
LQALEFTMPIFWSYLAMTAFAFFFAFPLAKWLGMSGALLGLLGAHSLFQGIVAVALLVRSRRTAQETVLASRPPALAE